MIAARGPTFNRFHDAGFPRRKRQDTGGGVRYGCPMQPTGPLRLALPFRPPYDWTGLLAFLARRTLAGVETVGGSGYARTMRSGGATGWVSVMRPDDADCLVVSVSAALVPHVDDVRTRLARLFDVDTDPQAVLGRLGHLAASNPGVRLPGAIDGFEIAVRGVLGQQVTVKAAHTVAGRFARAFGSPLAAEAPDGLETVFPRPSDVADRDVGEIAALGIVRSRAGAILGLAEAMARGTLRLEPGEDVPTQMAQLRAIRGIGEWTAQYLAMRALRWTDAFPHTDYGVRKALGTSSDREVLARSEAWRPWRAYAVMHLWRSLADAPA